MLQRFLYIKKILKEILKQSQTHYITSDQLGRLQWRIINNKTIEGLNRTLRTFDITSPERMRHFISQCMHESMYGLYVKELASGKAYEGIKDLGNIKSGDGPKYKGVGYIQVTGRNNYQSFSNFIKDPDVMKGVEYVSEKYPWDISGFWWHNNNMNKICDELKDASFDIKTIQVSRAVNTGNRYSRIIPNGLVERRKYYTKASEIIGQRSY